MYKRKNVTRLTEAEQQRQIEIQFYLYVIKLNELYGNASQTVTVLTALAELFECNILIVQKYIALVLHEDYKMCPTRREIVEMWYTIGIPVRTIAKKLVISTQMIYTVINMNVNYVQPPVSTHAEYTTLKKFIENFQKLKEI